MTSGVLILAGPTASGKTNLAIALAKEAGAEIVSADSRQIYRGMPIGTAAPSPGQLREVPHHLVAFLDPQQRYSAAEFVRDALATIGDIHARGKCAIVTGGTGFYIRALAGDVTLAGARDEVLRARLAHEARIHPPDVMHAWLAVLDPQRASRLQASDRYRVARALEIALMQRVEAQKSTDERESLRSRAIPYAKVYLDVPFAELERRIAVRVDRMLAEGLLEEAERIGAAAVAADAVGYPQALAYLRGYSTLPELRAQLVRATRRYARRQETWFRSEPDLVRVPFHDALGKVAALARAKGWV